MKSFLLIFFITLSASVLYAQEEEVLDSVVNISPIETESDSDDESYDDDESYEEPAHTLVDPNEVVRKTDYDDEEIKVKKFDSKKWKQVVQSTDYQEEEKPKKKAKEKKIGDGEEDKEEDEDSNINFSWMSPILQFLGYAVIIGIVLAILYFVTKSIKLDQRLDKRPMTADDPMRNVENIEELDVNQLLQKALAEGNFKLAVRLYFLRLLKGLHAGGVIAWKKDKTNRDYLSEIFARNFYFNEVRQLTLAYELLWYGEHVVTNEIYKELFSEFEAIQQKLTALKES